MLHLFEKLRFTVVVTKYYKNNGFRAMPTPVNVLTITRPKRAHQYINVSKYNTLHVYTSEDEFKSKFTTAIKSNISDDYPDFELRGHIDLLKFPLCVFDVKYGVYITEEQLDKFINKKA